MEKSNVIKPSLSDYNKLQEFASACAELNSRLTMLNNHIEVLKRSGDVESIRQLDKDIYIFLSKIVVDYKKTLKDKTDEDKE